MTEFEVEFTIEHATLGLPLCIGCESLRPGNDEVGQPWPCVGCGRMLRHRVHHRWADTFCSVACEDAVHARREQRRQRRARWRQGAICAGCGKWFRPKARGDAITCGSACRQKLYRQRRVTDRTEGRAVGATDV
jgi:hypothetical protein